MEHKMKTTNTKPPITIYDVLHEAEAAGIGLPNEIEIWWLEETRINEVKRDQKTTR